MDETLIHNAARSAYKFMRDDKTASWIFWYAKQLVKLADMEMCCQIEENKARFIKVNGSPKKNKDVEFEPCGVFVDE